MGLHTYDYGNFTLLRGQPFPFGATPVPGGVNFSIYSNHATAIALVLFKRDQPEPFMEIPIPNEFRLGNVASVQVLGLDYADIEYGYRVDGPFDPTAGHRFDPTRILLDPYAKSIGGRDVWAAPHRPNDIYPYRARLTSNEFDWEGDRPLEIPEADLIIYELHVRGFTAHPSAQVPPAHRGTYAGLQEKIPYLKALGVNCVELMPIFEFDELDNPRHNPLTGDRLFNYWGYSTVGFYAPKAGYAASREEGGINELKTLIKELHRNGIEVMLDVVFNHTAEGNEFGPTISFRGLDNRTYYMLTPEGHYLNFSGCGNTLNCNHPVVRVFVLDCLRYWASEYHIDGFRFDLASILGRDPQGVPLANPPLLEMLAFDPILAKCKLVAEAWDAGGLYQVGSFPDYDRWSEWNGKYRDTIRRFLRANQSSLHEVAERLQGSPDLYAKAGRTVDSSINFITAHDGFTLADLVSYNDKHNEANGEDNRDGANDNESWNCGEEGITTDPEINQLRRRQMRNAIAMLMVSQGIPMVLMGDEMGRTQFGNNNTYCHDSELNWLDWNLLQINADFFRFMKHCIAFRHTHPVLRSRQYLRHEDYVGSGYPDISWHGVNAWEPDWSEDCHTLAFLLCGKHARGGTLTDDYIYVAMNMHWEPHGFELPALPNGMSWHVFVNTAMQPPQDVWDIGHEPELSEQKWIMAAERSVLVLVGR